MRSTSRLLLYLALTERVPVIVLSSLRLRRQQADGGVIFSDPVG